MQSTPSRDEVTHDEIVLAMRERAWNALIPPCAVRADIQPFGVRYLHPTKGYRMVGKRRFAMRGVL